MSSAAATGPTVSRTHKARVVCGRPDALTAHTTIASVLVLHGDRVLSAGDEGIVRVWDYTTGECTNYFEAGGKPTIQAIAPLPGTRLLAVGGMGGAFVYSMDGPAKAFLVTSGAVQSMGVHRDTLLVGTQTGMVHMFNLPIDFHATPEPSYKTGTTHGCGGGCECTAKHAPRLGGQHHIKFQYGSAITALASLADDHFAVGDTSGTIYIVNGSTRKTKFTIKAHVGDLTALAVLPGPAAAAAAAGGAASATGGAGTKTDGGKGAAAAGAAAAGATGARLASASRSGEVILWNPATGKRVAKLLSAGSSMLFGMTVLPGSNRLVAATVDGILHMWNVDKPDRVSTLSVATPDAMGPLSILGLPGGRIMSAAGDLALHVHDVRTGARKLIMCGHGRWDVAAVGVSPDGSRITTADTKGVLIVWDAETRCSVHKITSPRAGRFDSEEQLAVMTDGTIISGRPDGLRMWSPATGKLIGRRMARGPYVVALPGNAFAAPGAYGLDAFVRSPTATYDDPDSAFVSKWRLKGPAFATGSVGALAMLSDSELAVAIPGEVLVVDVETGEALRSFDTRGRRATSMAADVTGTCLAVASAIDNIVVVYNISDQSVRHSFRDFGAGPTTLAALPDGRIAACQGAPRAEGFKSCLPFMGMEAPDERGGEPVERSTLMALRRRERAAIVKILNPHTKRLEGAFMTHARGSAIPIAALPDGRIVTSRMNHTRDPEPCIWSLPWTRRRHALAALALRRSAEATGTGGAAAGTAADASVVDAVATSAAAAVAETVAAAVAGAGTAAV